MKEILKKQQDQWQFYWKILATNWGLVDSHLNYSKFILLGQPRSGSNFLMSLLESHKQAVTYGELFVNPDYIGWHRSQYDQYLQSDYLISLMKNHPRKFLEKQVFRKYSPSVLAVGFKIFYNQGREDSREAVWPFLQSQQDIKIFHLKRKNSLKMLLSFKKALATGQWILINNHCQDYPKEVMISLTYEECLDYFQSTEENIEKHDLLFKEHPKIDIYYEDLSKDYQGEMRRVQDFLGLEPQILQPFTVKQSSQSLAQSITNYYELKEQFQNSPWQVFFED